MKGSDLYTRNTGGRRAWVVATILLLIALALPFHPVLCGNRTLGVLAGVAGLTPPPPGDPGPPCGGQLLGLHRRTPGPTGGPPARSGRTPPLEPELRPGPTPPGQHAVRPPFAPPLAPAVDPLPTGAGPGPVGQARPGRPAHPPPGPGSRALPTGRRHRRIRLRSHGLPGDPRQHAPPLRGGPHAGAAVGPGPAPGEGHRGPGPGARPVHMGRLGGGGTRKPPFSPPWRYCPSWSPEPGVGPLLPAPWPAPSSGHSAAPSWPAPTCCRAWNISARACTTTAG